MSTIQTLQRDFARVAVAAIVTAAMVLTFEGTMRFTQAHGALGWRGAAIAGMNDLAVLVGILWPQKPLQALAGLCSIFTIWANLAHASSGAAGVAVALVPPVLAIAMVAALEYEVHRIKVTQPVTQADPLEVTVTPEVAQDDPQEVTPDPEPVADDPAPVGGSTSDRVAWVRRQPVTPTLTEMVTLFGYSDSSAKRDLRAAKAPVTPVLKVVND